jgi:hypothetical protein
MAVAEVKATLRDAQVTKALLVVELRMMFLLLLIFHSMLVSVALPTG